MPRAATGACLVSARLARRDGGGREALVRHGQRGHRRVARAAARLRLRGQAPELSRASVAQQRMRAARAESRRCQYQLLPPLVLAVTRPGPVLLLRLRACEGAAISISLLRPRAVHPAPKRGRLARRRDRSRSLGAGVAAQAAVGGHRACVSAIRRRTRSRRRNWPTSRSRRRVTKAPAREKTAYRIYYSIF